MDLLEPMEIYRTKELMKERLQATIRRDRFILSSGKVSDFYIDARQITLDSFLSRFIGFLILARMRKLDLNAIAGPTIAACPMISAAGAVAAEHLERKDLPVLAYVRSEAKDHGLGKTIEGPGLTPDHRVLLVDDVLTTGGSLLQAAAEIIETGADVHHAFVLGDRQEGGQDRLQEADIELHHLFTKANLL